jgi:hypothetical protein
MAFQIRGLSPQVFQPLFALDDAALAERGIQRVIADDTVSFPCRVSLAHALPGEELLLLSHAHQPAPSPYQAAGPIFVRRNATATDLAPGEIPEPVRVRLLSVRAYDRADCIVDAEVIEGRELAPLITKMFDNDAVAYLHVHYARRGCYGCRVDRA